MTVRPEQTATVSAANRLHMASGQFLYDDGHSTSCKTAIGKIQGGHWVGGCVAARAHDASRMRQEGNVAVVSARMVIHPRINLVMSQLPGAG